MCVNYTRIEQEFLLDKFNTFKSRMLLLHKKKHRSSPICGRFCENYFDLNQQMLHFFDRLRAYNRRWSSFVTVYFVVHTFFIVHIMYGLLAESSMTFDLQKRFYFIFFTFELTIIMVAITNECSKIVRNNVRIYKINTALCYVYQERKEAEILYLIKVN